MKHKRAKFSGYSISYIINVPNFLNQIKDYFLHFICELSLKGLNVQQEAVLLRYTKSFKCSPPTLRAFQTFVVVLSIQ